MLRRRNHKIGEDGMMGTRQRIGRRQDSSTSPLAVSNHEPETSQEEVFILFTQGGKEGARATLRPSELDPDKTTKPLRAQPHLDMLFVQTEASPPIGTVVTLMAAGAHGMEEPPSFEGAVSFVCPAADQFGFSCGVGIRVTKHP